jgi:hypothetical protein
LASLADFTAKGQGRFMARRFPVIVLSTLLLTGCGGNPKPAIGFINHTRHSDTQLWVLWKAAQLRLSQQIDINPLRRVGSSVPPNLLPGDARVWNVSPRKLTVSAQADVPSATLYAATGVNRPDPTGLISCPAPCNVSYAAAYSLYRGPVSRYAASWEFSANNFDALVL